MTEICNHDDGFWILRAKASGNVKSKIVPIQQRLEQLFLPSVSCGTIGAYGIHSTLDMVENSLVVFRHPLSVIGSLAGRCFRNDSCGGASCCAAVSYFGGRRVAAADGSTVAYGDGRL